MKEMKEMKDERNEKKIKKTKINLKVFAAIMILLFFSVFLFSCEKAQAPAGSNEETKDNATESKLIIINKTNESKTNESKFIQSEQIECNNSIPWMKDNKYYKYTTYDKKDGIRTITESSITQENSNSFLRIMATETEVEGEIATAEIKIYMDNKFECQYAETVFSFRGEIFNNEIECPDLLYCVDGMEKKTEITTVGAGTFSANVYSLDDLKIYEHDNIILKTESKEISMELIELRG